MYSNIHEHDRSTPTEPVKRPEVHRAVSKNQRRQTTENQQRNSTERSNNRKMKDEEYVNSGRNICVGHDSSDGEEWHDASDSDWKTEWRGGA